MSPLLKLVLMKLQNVTTLHPGCSAADKKNDFAEGNKTSRKDHWLWSSVAIKETAEAKTPLKSFI